MKKVFIKGNREALKNVALLLLEEFSKGKLADLSALTVVLPGRRAGRRLREILAELCAEKKLFFLPPKIATPNSLLETITSLSGAKLVTPIEETAAWRSVLEKNKDSLAPLFTLCSESLPKDFLLEPETAIDSLTNLRTDLARHNLSCADVLKLGDFSDEFEYKRWETLQKLNEEYEALLLKNDLIDKVMAWREEDRSFSSKIALIGLADLPPVLLKLLEKNEEEIFIIPVGDPAWFTEEGLLKTEAAFPPLKEKTRAQIKIFSNPLAEAEYLWKEIIKIAPNLSVTDITIASESSDLIPYLRNFCEESSLELHEARGKLWEQTEPGFFCQALQALLTSAKENFYLNFLRIPCVEMGLSNQTKAFVNLEDAVKTWQNCTLKRMGDYPKPWTFKDSEACSALFIALEKLLQPWRQELPEKEWPIVFQKTLKSLVLSGTPEDSEAWRATKNLLASFESARLDGGKISGAEFLKRLTSAAKATHITLQTESEALDFVGWLETALDDTPLLFLCGVNENILPKGHSSDPFLPESLKIKLGIPGTFALLQRDRYYLRLLEEGRDLKISSLRIAQNDQKLKPSRLLCDEMEKTEIKARYIENFYGGSETLEPSGQLFSEIFLPKSSVALPPIEEVFQKRLDLSHLSASSFNTFAKCPRRFALEQAQIKTPESNHSEMPAYLLGTIAHSALQKMAEVIMEGKLRFDHSRISEFLQNSVDEIAEGTFGNFMPPLVRFQLEQLKIQLDAFALAEVYHQAEGWEIAAVELKKEKKVGDTTVVCRLDRVDVRMLGYKKEILIIDYKTGAYKKTAREESEDLQIPFYRWALADEEPEDTNWYYSFVNFSREKDKNTFFNIKPFPVPNAPFHSMVINLINLIKQSNFPPACPSVSFCKYCPYYDSLCYEKDRNLELEPISKLIWKDTFWDREEQNQKESQKRLEEIDNVLEAKRRKKLEEEKKNKNK